MRIALPLAALLLSTAAAPAPTSFETAPLLAYQSAATTPSWQAFDRAPAISVEDQKACADRIQMVREEHGLPKVERDTESTDEALFILAVDKRIDGCSVMVMAHDTDDIRPLPTEQGRGELIPAR